MTASANASDGEPNGVYWHAGVWSDTPPKLVGPMDLGSWSATSVFDGPRSVGGGAPDLDRHCQRAVNSARAMMLEPNKTAEEIRALAIEGIRRMPLAVHVPAAHQDHLGPRWGRPPPAPGQPEQPQAGDHPRPPRDDRRPT